MAEIVLNSKYFTSLYKARNNILDILENSGYNVDDYKEFSMHELHSIIQNNELDICVSRNNVEDDSIGKKVLVHFYEVLSKNNKTLRDKNIDNLIEEIFYIQQQLQANDRLIIIVNDDPNDTLINYLKLQWEKNHILVNVISLKRLQFNILQHKMVPTHDILSNKDKDEFYEKYNIVDIKQIPEISRFDPVAQVIGIKPGEICKIKRPSKTAIDALYYRACVNY